MLKIISTPIQFVQSAADKIGMYRVVSGTLGFLALLSITAGAFGLITYSALEQIFALAIALLVALLLNTIIAKILKIPANHESAVITALILFFLTAPAANPIDNWPVALATAIGVISKYVIVYKKQHLLNPAAFGAVALSITGLYSFNWWIANPVLFVPLVLLGVFVVMKVRRWVPVLTFIGVSLILYLATSLSYGEGLFSATTVFFVSWPALFLAFYMLTEPFTMPATKEAQVLYGGIVAFLANASIVSTFTPMTPELALVIGNIVIVPWRLNQKLFLEFIGRNEIAKNTYEFVFKKPAGFSYIAGQYLEWMLPHEKPDSRGVRRYFTIASAPTESTVRLALKVVENGSTFKSGLLKLEPGDKIVASQLAGDFVLPKESSKKIGLIAGGIGVTPFRSHLQYMVDTGIQHDTAFFYCNNTPEDMAYASMFNEMKNKLAFNLVPVFSKGGSEPHHESGYVNGEMITRRAPDYLERTWYISGPPVMVNASVTNLLALGVKKKNIKTDFFPGLA